VSRKANNGSWFFHQDAALNFGLKVMSWIKTHLDLKRSVIL